MTCSGTEQIKPSCLLHRGLLSYTHRRRCCWWAPPPDGHAGSWQCPASGLCLRDTGTCSGPHTRLRSGSLRTEEREHGWCESGPAWLISFFFHFCGWFRAELPCPLNSASCQHHLHTIVLVWAPLFSFHTRSILFGWSADKHPMMIGVERTAGTEPCHIAVIATSDLFPVCCCCRRPPLPAPSADNINYASFPSQQ